MGSDQIKNLVKEEAGKLAVEGGSFGFVSLALVRRRSEASFTEALTLSDLSAALDRGQA